MTILNLNKTIVLVKVPESAHGIDIWEATMSLMGYKKGELHLCYFHNHESYKIKLPPGSWTILGLAKDLSEDKWREIVEWYTDSNDSSYDPQYNVTTYFDVFKDYVTGDVGELDTATESARSLLTRENLEWETTLILIKK